MKIVHLTSIHPPFDSRIFFKECRALCDAGHEVILIAPETDDKITGGIRLSGITKARSRIGRLINTQTTIIRRAFAAKADIYHFHDPELIVCGFVLKLFGKKVIYDVHEDLPRQVYAKSWIPGFFKHTISRTVEFIEKIAGWVFDGVVAATPLIAGRFPKSRTITVQNFPIQAEIQRFDALTYSTRAPNVAYVGGLTNIRGTREMLAAITLVAPQLPTVRLVMAGVFDSVEFENTCRKTKGWELVEFKGWQSREGVSKILAESRIGLVVLHPAINYLDSYPVKLFEYMSAGIPVVASDFPLWREIIGGAGCGLLVDPLDSSAIARAIKWLLENPEEAEKMGQRGAQAVADRFNWEPEAKKLLDLYQRLSRE